MPENHVALAALAAPLALAFLTWLASVVRHDVSLVDRAWGLLIASAASVCAALLPGAGDRRVWMLALVWIWALRLSAYVSWRNWGHGEDRRYQAIRARNQPNFALKSLYLIFLLQAVLAWLVAAPFLAAFFGGTGSPAPLGLLDALGIALAAFGVVSEAVADQQMARFKADPAHRGQVMDRGLWRFSRHPNYFGECCLWWGFWLMALGAAGIAGAWWSVVSPIVMTVLLLKVSGVSLLERDIAERRPGYREYVARTNAFFPGWPRADGRG